MIVYPDENYDSWISEDDADTYFETRLNTEAWNIGNKEAALMTAFRSIQELDIEIDLTDADVLNALQMAQCEQALHELINTLDGPGINTLKLGGMLSVKISENQIPIDRYSMRSIAILKPYITLKTVSRTR